MKAAWMIPAAADALANDGVIAYPTEGVWGLGCLPESQAATSRILAMKRRPVALGLILIAPDIELFEPYLAGLSAAERGKLASGWPGPLTWLVPDNGTAPWWVRGDHDTVALRVSDHPVVRLLCDAVAAPIVSTSANVSGAAPARTALRARIYFRDAVDVYVPGPLGNRRGASEIRDLATGRVIRSS